MSKQILEQVLEHILNKEEAKASERLHQYFVEKGRSIYESLIEQDELAEEDVFEIDDEMTDDEQGDFADDIRASKHEIENEEMFSEADEDMDMDTEEEGEMDMDDEMDMDTEEEGEMDIDDEDMDDEEEGADMSAVQDAVLDVEDALDELKSLFAELQAGGDEEESEEPLGESTDLMAVAKPTPGDNGQNAKSPIPANSGQKGMTAHPVKLGADGDEKGGTVGQPKDMSISAGNKPGQKKAPALSQVKAPAKPEAATGRSPIAGK